jgi:hypothetical protein
MSLLPDREGSWEKAMKYGITKAMRIPPRICFGKANRGGLSSVLVETPTAVIKVHIAA